MTARVYLHIGPYKSGTTFIQRVLSANQAELAAHGLCVPAQGYVRQWYAVLDVLGRKLYGEPGAVRGHWRRLVREIEQWSGPAAVISAETLCRAREPQIERLVSSLQPAEVHVVYTARDPSRVIPGMWQTYLHSRASEPWESYLASVRGDAGSESSRGAAFWNQQDPRNVLARWQTQVPAARIHVVTVPPSGATVGVLWERFCSVLGVDPSPYSLQTRRANESLGTAEAELLRLVNARLDGVRRRTYARWVKQFAAREVLGHRSGQRRFALPEQEQTWLRPRAEDICRFLQQGGYDVVGELTDLLPAPAGSSAVAPDAAEVEEVLDAAVDVIARLLRRIDREDQRRDEQRREEQRPATRPGRPSGVRRLRRRVKRRLRRAVRRVRRVVTSPVAPWPGARRAAANPVGDARTRAGRRRGSGRQRS